jgi:hypothetical protein
MLYPQLNIPQYPVVGGPQSPSGLCGEVKTFYPTGVTLKKERNLFKWCILMKLNLHGTDNTSLI